MGNAMEDKQNWCIWDVVLEVSDESVVDGEKNTCMGAGKHQSGMDTGIESGTSCSKILWTFGEAGTRNGKWCHARGDERKEKARKAKNKIAGQYEHHERTFHYQHGMGCQRLRQTEMCYRGCRQGSDITRRHKVTRWLIDFIVVWLQEIMIVFYVDKSIQSLPAFEKKWAITWTLMSLRCDVTTACRSRRSPHCRRLSIQTPRHSSININHSNITNKNITAFLSAPYIWSLCPFKGALPCDTFTNHYVTDNNICC